MKYNKWIAINSTAQGLSVFEQFDEFMSEPVQVINGKLTVARSRSIEIIDNDTNSSILKHLESLGPFIKVFPLSVIIDEMVIIFRYGVQLHLQ